MIRNFSIFLFAATFFTASPAFAQGTMAITGRVINADDGTPIAGVAAYIPEKGTGFVTDTQGRFSTAAEAGDIILFSHPEYREAMRTILKEGFHDMGDIKLKKESRTDEDDPAIPADKSAAQGTAAITGCVINAEA